MRWENPQKHVWSRWSKWKALSNVQEMKERHCLDQKCGAVERKWRKRKDQK